VIQPLEHVGAGLSTLLDDPSAIAVAAPTRTAADVGNAGSATISAGAIIDVADPNLLAAATIEFIDASTYSINGAGSFAYTSGADIDVNGTRVQTSSRSSRMPAAPAIIAMHSIFSSSSRPGCSMAAPPRCRRE
jgi:flagellar hook-associated protein 1 FlgK